METAYEKAMNATDADTLEARYEKAIGLLKEFVSTIDVTGGVMVEPEDENGFVPVADEEWVDLAEAYLGAREFLRKNDEYIEPK